MQQIGRKADQVQSSAKSAERLEVYGASGAGVILPKLLRRPARYAHRLLSGGFYLTPKSLAIFGCAFLFAVVVGGIVASGKSNVVMAKANSYNLLTVKHYEVSGNDEISDVDVVRILAPKNGETLFGYDVTKARELLKENPWIADATVAKVYPNKVAVHIKERSAFGVWQQHDNISLIDRDGRSLAQFDGRPDLPLFVGEGVKEEAAKLIDVLNRYPDVATRVTAHIRIENRRWDLQMGNEVRVLLPENGYENELQRLAGLNDEYGIFERDLTHIDMRQSDRLVLKLGQDAVQVRDTLLNEQEEALKTAIARRHL